VSPLKRERLVRPQAGVAEHHEQRRVAQPSLTDQLGPHDLDQRRRDRLNCRPVGFGRLARELDGVAGHAAPLDRLLQDALSHGHRLADRIDADAGRLELGAKARDRLWREIAQRQLPESRERVPVPQLRVDPERRAFEVRAGVDDEPPFLDELGAREVAKRALGARRKTCFALSALSSYRNAATPERLVGAPPRPCRRALGHARTRR
jgi:hypothetical protein